MSRWRVMMEGLVRLAGCTKVACALYEDSETGWNEGRKEGKKEGRNQTFSLGF
jgi:hypothetical protein